LLTVKLETELAVEVGVDTVTVPPGVPGITISLAVVEDFDKITAVVPPMAAELI
jgi:hypothetical protein